MILNRLKTTLALGCVPALLFVPAFDARGGDDAQPLDEFSVASAAVATDEDRPGGNEGVPVNAVAKKAGPRVLTYDRGPENVPVRVPQDENLVFDAVIDLGPLGEMRGGTVTLSSGTEPYSSGLPMPGQAPVESGRLTGWIQSRAEGSHLGYKLDHTVRTRLLPQEWPRIFHTDKQQGSENRQRELKIGDDKAWARHNSHCSGCDRREHFVESNVPIFGEDHHCKKCKRAEHRVWRDGTEREIPEGTVDILAAIFLARTMVEDEVDEVSFPMLTRLELWDVTLKRGASLKKRKTPAGEFLCRQVSLTTSVPEGEDRDADDFRGLFGMHGTIRIWVHDATGIPVAIEGTVPLGPLDLDVHVRLKSYEGTPEAFVPRK